MSILTIFFSLLALSALIMVIHLWWVWKNIRFHSDVEPIEIAFHDQELVGAIHNLVKKISEQAGIRPPALFIRRAQLPNAFVVATIMRSELYFTDEFFEEANNRDDKLHYFLSAICHEIAHLKNNDHIPLGLLNYLKYLATTFGINRLAYQCEQHINRIEEQADCTANLLLENFSQNT